MRLIHFAHEIPESERDKKLLDKLKGELPGILNWALKGHEEWKNAGLQTPSKVIGDSAAYQNELNNVRPFLESMVEYESGEFTSASALWTGYTTWCEENLEQIRPQRTFRRDVKTFFKGKNNVIHRKSNGRMGYEGIKVRRTSFF